MEIDWNPLLCVVSALRYELRATAYATLSAAAKRPEDAGKYIAQMEHAQKQADRVSNGGKA